MSVPEASPETGRPCGTSSTLWKTGLRLLPFAPGPLVATFDPRSTSSAPCRTTGRGNSERPKRFGRPGNLNSDRQPGRSNRLTTQTGSRTNQPATGDNHRSRPGDRRPGLGGAGAARSAREPQLGPRTTSVVDRSERHENAFQQRRDDATIQGAEKSQRAALEAVQAFAQRTRSNILTKIQDAAKAEPGGMQAVLSEMREGGRFASLRSQFNADLAPERGAAAAWERWRAASNNMAPTGGRRRDRRAAEYMQRHSRPASRDSTRRSVRLPRPSRATKTARASWTTSATSSAKSSIAQ